MSKPNPQRETEKVVDIMALLKKSIDRADAAPAASLIPAAEIDAIGALIEEADRTARWLCDNAWKMDGLNQNVAKQMRIRATALEAAKRAVTVRA